MAAMAMTVSAAAPEGDLYVLGFNGATTPAPDLKLVALERSEEDIDEGLWRWKLENLDVTVPSGSFTISGSNGFTLGFDADNDFGFSNEVSEKQTMMYLAEGGAPVNYNLKAGSYGFTLVLFEDLDGDMGGDTWMVQVSSNSVSDDDSYFLLGFNGAETPSSAVRFVRQELEEDGETYYIYTIPRFYVDTCPEGFTVADPANDAVYGLNPDFASMSPEVTAENPMVFMAPDGESVKCSLDKGYYTVNFSQTGAMAMISFIKCENQTPNNELAYYLVGVNGVTTANPEYKFTRKVENLEYEDEGETIVEVMVTYELNDVAFDSTDGLTIVAENDLISFGYNSDMASVMPNDFSVESPFAMLVANGSPLNCTLPASKYNFKFSLTGESTGMLTAIDASENAVSEIGAEEEYAPEYYSVSGVRVQNPVDGIYIVKRGDKVSKIVVRRF